MARPTVYNLPPPPETPEEIPYYLQELTAEIEKYFYDLEQKKLDKNP